MLDVPKFTKELTKEIKERFPDYFPEDSEVISQLVNLMSLVAATALEKYELENPR